MADLKFVHVGLGDVVCANHVIAVIQYGTETGRKYRQYSRRAHKYIDATHGKKIKAYLILDEGTVMASHISVATLQRRLTSLPSTDTGIDDYMPPENPYEEEDDDDDEEEEAVEEMDDDDDDEGEDDEGLSE